MTVETMVEIVVTGVVCASRAHLMTSVCVCFGSVCIMERASHYDFSAMVVISLDKSLLHTIKM